MGKKKVLTVELKDPWFCGKSAEPDMVEYDGSCFFINAGYPVNNSMVLSRRQMRKLVKWAQEILGGE